MTLPTPGCRWTAYRKCSVVRAIESGAITRQQAMSIYHISDDELRAWRQRDEAYGRNGLRATYAQQYRLC